MPEFQRTSAINGERRNLSDEVVKLLVFAEDLARRAGQHIRGAAFDRATAVTKSNSADWLTPIDGQAEDLIREAISQRYPAHAIVGEERPSQGDIDEASIIWYVDPIDGTTNFLYGLGNVSVSIAARDAEGLLIGVVHDVYRDQTIGAARGAGVRIDGSPAGAMPPPESVTGQVVLTEWSGGYHAWPGMEHFLNWVGTELGTVRIIGSCALSLAHAGLGRVAATILPGRYNSWDVAAGIVIATEGGCRLLDATGPVDGLPANGLLVAGKGVADAVWEAWRAAGV